MDWVTAGPNVGRTSPVLILTNVWICVLGDLRCLCKRCLCYRACFKAFCSTACPKCLVAG